MAATRAEKEQELQELTAAFRNSDSAILVDYRGLNVPQVTDLRRQLRAARAQYKVVKNTLAKRASKGTSFETLQAHFEGTTAIAYTGEDVVALAKVLTTFMKGVPSLSIKAAVVQGQAIKPAEVTDLASMPGRPERSYSSCCRRRCSGSSRCLLRHRATCCRCSCRWSRRRKAKRNRRLTA
jgi:large subunit ribosomal protein L10